MKYVKSGRLSRLEYADVNMTKAVSKELLEELKNVLERHIHVNDSQKFELLEILHEAEKVGQPKEGSSSSDKQEPYSLSKSQRISEEGKYVGKRKGSKKVTTMITKRKHHARFKAGRKTKQK